MKTAKSFHVLGNAHFKMGDFPAAVEAFRKVSDMRSNLLGDHDDTALSYDWLGSAQFSMGDLDGALETFRTDSLIRRGNLMNQLCLATIQKLCQGLSWLGGWKCSIM